MLPGRLPRSEASKCCRWRTRSCNLRLALCHGTRQTLRPSDTSSTPSASASATASIMQVGELLRSASLVKGSIRGALPHPLPQRTHSALHAADRCGTRARYAETACCRNARKAEAGQGALPGPQPREPVARQQRPGGCRWTASPFAAPIAGSRSGRRTGERPCTCRSTGKRLIASFHEDTFGFLLLGFGTVQCSER